MIPRFTTLLFFICAAAQLSRAQPAPTTEPVNLGELFQSRGSGIQLQPPAGGTLVREISSGDIVRFVFPSRGWDIHVKLTHSTKPVPLTLPRDPSGAGGVLELTTDQLKAADPSAEFLEQDVKQYPPYDVGKIIVRAKQGTGRALIQQAIFREDDQTYYTIQFTTGTTTDAAGATFEPQHETAAHQAFELMLPTVKLLDRSALKLEQEQRLFRTLAFYDLLHDKKILSVLQPQQVMRITRDGQDVGYIVVTELPANHAGNDGYEVVQRSHLESEVTPQPTDSPEKSDAPGPPAPTLPALPGVMALPSPNAPSLTKVDRVATFFSTFDRRHEDWSIITTIDTGQAPPLSASELGNSDQEVHQSLDRDALAGHKLGDAVDPKQPPVVARSRYVLSVNTYRQSKPDQPVNRELPPFYLPLAMAQILPELLPLDLPDTFMFYSYVSDQREVMARYVDVLPTQDVKIDGKSVQAIPVQDRIGVDGSATIHYLSPDGHWLGSINQDQKLTVLPSDQQTVQQLWKSFTLQNSSPPGAPTDKTR